MDLRSILNLLISKVKVLLLALITYNIYSSWILFKTLLLRRVYFIFNKEINILFWVLIY